MMNPSPRNSYSPKGATGTVAALLLFPLCNNSVAMPSLELQSSLCDFARYATLKTKETAKSPKIVSFLKEHPEVESFLEKLYPLLRAVYGSFQISEEIWENPIDISEKRLYLTINTSLDSDEKISDAEHELFKLIENNNMVDTLKYVSIEQNWINV